MIAIQISTITKDEETGEPTTAYKIDFSDIYTNRELLQFYLYLKHCVRHIEKMIDEDLYEND